MSNPAPRYFIIDAFTTRLFAGNSAAVVLLDRWPDDAALQRIAMEFNLAATAYLAPAVEGFDLRWFTPKAEVPLCGHATLASARALAELGQLAEGGSVDFSTRSGVLTAKRQGPRYLLDFPALAVESLPAPPGLLESLPGAAPLYIGRGKFDLLVEVESQSQLLRLAPDFRQLAALDARGVIVTARSEVPQYDFVSRFFAPAIGVDEDPVTGSAHCLLGPYWSGKLGKSKLTAYQASPRGGVLHVEVSPERVALAGEAVIFAAGQLYSDGSD